ADRNARRIDDRRILGVGRDEVLEVGVLEQELVNLVGADLPGVSGKDRVIAVADRAERARKDDRARAVLVRVALHAVAGLQELLGVEVNAGFRSEQVIFERRGDHRAVLAGIEAAGVNDVVRGALGALGGDEERGPVLDDRTADRRAVLIAAIRRFAGAGDRLA